MRPTIRHALRSKDLRAGRQPFFVCRSCREQASPASFTSTSIALTTISKRHASSSNENEKLPYTERLRRKIWATDVPPGQKDPYARLSPEERATEIEERSRLAKETSKSDEETPERVFQKPQLNDEATQEVSTGGRSSAKVDEEAQDSSRPQGRKYGEATTWDGLDQIGGAKGWWEEVWDQENQFKGYL